MKNPFFYFLLVFIFYGVSSCSDIDRADSLRLNNNFKEAAKLYQKAADHGDGYAMWRLSNLYYTGRGVDYNEEQAVALLRKSADTGCEKAICDTLIAHIKGYYFFTKDPQSVFNEYVKFSENSEDPDVRARYAGLIYDGVEGFLEQDHEKAEEILNEIEDKSNERYLHTMGFIYCHGTTQTEIDENKAIELWEKCKDYHLIGNLYECGGSQVKKDINKAIEYYKKGVECESSVSMRELALVYTRESTDSVYGKYRDTKSAKILLQNAIKHGNGDACDDLGQWYSAGKNGVEIDEKKAAEYFIKAYKYHSTNGSVNAGTTYLTGRGCDQNLQKCIECWEWAAERGSSEAAYRLFNIYSDRTPKFDLNRARFYIEKAAKLGNASACYVLGKNYYYGTDLCKEDVPLAFSYIKKAADQGHYEACYFVSQMYERGQGCEVNMKLAKEYERKSQGE